MFLKLTFRIQSKALETRFQDDKSFLSMMESNIYQRGDGHYEMPLPIRNSILTSSTTVLAHLKSKFKRDCTYKEDFVSFMSEMISEGYAEEAPSDQIGHFNAWYNPHHGVYNCQKQKIRAVFDCSTKYLGRSLNDCLLPGPDLTNSLLGLLCRFRECFINSKLVHINEITFAFFGGKMVT